MGRKSKHQQHGSAPAVEFKPSPVQMQFLEADQDIVIFGGGAKSLVPR